MFQQRIVLYYNHKTEIVNTNDFKKNDKNTINNIKSV